MDSCPNCSAKPAHGNALGVSFECGSWAASGENTSPKREHWTENCGMLASIRESNEAIQSFISHYGTEVPSDLIQMIADLDHSVRP